MAHYPPEHKGGEQAGHKAPTVGRYAASDSRWSKTPDRAIGFIGMLTWATLMAKMRRKTLIVCADCHDLIHAGPVAHAA